MPSVGCLDIERKSRQRFEKAVRWWAITDLSHPKNWGLNEKAHATLTLCYRGKPDDYPPRRLFLDVVKFLKEQLELHSGPGRAAK